MAKTVVETLATLKELQVVDDRLSELRESVAGLSLRVDEHRRRVTELEAELGKKAEELKSDEKGSAMKELELKVIQGKIDKLKTQLNTLNSNKQYATMMAEINEHKAQGSRASDEALALLDRVEVTRSAMDELHERIKEAEETVRGEEAVVAGEVQELTVEMRELAAERQALSQQLEKSVVDKYQRISHGKGGKAVVAVMNGVCQGCFMGVTRQTIARLWAKKELMYCPNCARMIYLEGEVQ